MKHINNIFLAVFLSLCSIILFEGFYILNFINYRFTDLLPFNTSLICSYLIFISFQIAILFLISEIGNSIFKHISKWYSYILISGVVVFLECVYIDYMTNRLLFREIHSLIPTIFILFLKSYIYLYSIYYENLLE